MRSCLVLSSPRAGTHLVMAGLLASGMAEAQPLTSEDWNEDRRCNTWRVLNMPPNGFYRFGAHMGEQGIVDAFRETDLRAIMITRDLIPQAESFRAYQSVIRGIDFTLLECKERVIDRNEHIRAWVGVPGVLCLRYEDLSIGIGWDRIFEHLDGEVDIPSIVELAKPREGKAYWKNTIPSKEYYERPRV